MQAPQRTPRRPFPSLPAGAVAVMALALACGSAIAKPEAPHPERIGRFLADVALTPPAPVAMLAAPAPALAQPPATVAPGAAAQAGRPNIAERVRDGASGMVLTAMNFLGVPYKRGGSSEESGFDCSGFTRHIFEMSLGLVLPRKADQQAHAPGLVPVGRNELKPGDLVFFNTLKRTFSHVGIYVGEGKFIHAPRPGGEVRVEEMSLAYWKKRFTGARRVEGAQQPQAAAVAAGTAETATAASAPSAIR
jgi:cell wall-associated NlpC family hydrolase